MRVPRVLAGPMMAVLLLVPGCGGDEEALPSGDQAQDQEGERRPPGTVLAQGAGTEGTWELAVSRSDDQGLCLTLHMEEGQGAVCDYAEDPPVLDEAHAWLVDDDGQAATLVAGPVAGEAERVEVVTDQGRVDADVRDVEGVRVYVARLEGRHAIDAVTAWDAEGAEVDRRTLPPDPPWPDTPAG